MSRDIVQRQRAIDVRRSCIVQAPAGSGKTELLIQRMLALLAQVDEPKHILAITFTNKAAAEMRERILAALMAAVTDDAPHEDHKRKTWDLAQAVIAKHGDRLMRNPGQLTIQTIDSFNATLVRRMPWMTRFGRVPDISDDPESLYQCAVEQLLGRLTGTDDQESLQKLLRHLDNQVQDLQRLLINMLKQRDQWLGILMQNSGASMEGLQHVVKEFCADKIAALCQVFPAGLIDELLWCARYAAAQLERKSGRSCPDLSCLPGPDYGDLDGWLYFADLLLTADGRVRKQVNKNHGFPSGKEHKSAKEKMLHLLKSISEYPDFLHHLKEVSTLPRAEYGEKQWQVLQSLIELLPLLVAELWLVFRARGQVDFSEIALKAIQALGDSDNPSDLLLKIDQNLKHILVDEFQDTSRLQYSLLNHLISGWSEGDGRTLFLVGDPMQSIYRFREAEVGLFLHCFKGDFGLHGKKLEPLQLTANFRSQKGIVDWVNQTFVHVFPDCVDELCGAVSLTEAEAVKPVLAGEACLFYPYLERNDSEEARQVIKIINAAMTEDPQQSIAILVRGRNHLAEILPLLRSGGISYQAQDIDLLGAKPAALDIAHLTKALLHRGDRLSWLAVLRAPWCGLTLTDLHHLFADSTQTVPALLAENERLKLLSEDGRKRLARVWPVLSTALGDRGRKPLRELVESCWLSLGGHYCCDSEGRNDVQRVFDLLENLDEGGELQSLDLLDRGLRRLFADPDTHADGRLQIMTIHKAKGLEFDTVIIPGLGKMPRHQDSPLLRWYDHPEYGLMMAPVNEKGGQAKDPLYRLLAQLEAEKADHETARLLYVATTRAVNRLHLLGHARVDSQGKAKAQSGSLLAQMWPLVSQYFTGCETHPPCQNRNIQSPQLRRLQSCWSQPHLSSVSLAKPQKMELPSEGSTDNSEYDLFSGWEDPVHRHVGTIVHQQLEHLAKRGIDRWSDRDAEQYKAEIRKSLGMLGVGEGQLDDAVNKVDQAVEKCLQGERGRWILFPHHQHACEYPLSGVIAGNIVHAVIDRTFIADGIRWVIDYKTSAPKAGETVEVFYAREAEHYQKQLSRYAQLFQLCDENVPVRSALYFPLIDGWYELS